MFTCRRATHLLVEGIQVYLLNGYVFTCRRATCLLVEGLRVYL